MHLRYEIIKYAMNRNMLKNGVLVFDITKHNANIVEVGWGWGGWYFV